MESAPMDPEQNEPVVVPHTDLAADVLKALVESFVLREGTDYGQQELDLQDKVGRVIRELERGEARIVFDPDTETVSIVLARSILARELQRP